MDDCQFPEGFFDIGGKNFLWVFQNKPEYVDFTIHEMKDPSGLHKLWKNYCIRKKNITVIRKLQVVEKSSQVKS